MVETEPAACLAERVAPVHAVRGGQGAVWVLNPLPRALERVGICHLSGLAWALEIEARACQEALARGVAPSEVQLGPLGLTRCLGSAGSLG